MLPHISPQEIILILVIALVLFGPRKLPEFARGVGEAIREFRSSISNATKPEPEKLPAPAEAKKAE